MSFRQYNFHCPSGQGVIISHCLRSGVDVADIVEKVYGAIEKYSDENLDWGSGES